MNQEVIDLIQRWPLIKEFKLPENANVVVVGAYKGLACEALMELYPTINIAAFEPQSWAYEEAQTRLRNYFNVIVYNIGLGVENALLDMGEWHTDAASFVNTGPGSRLQGTGYIGEAGNLLKMAGFEHIDLMVCNIEGYEYLLIPYLRQIGWLEKIDRLAVQWHLGLGSDPKFERDVDNYIFDLYEKDFFTLKIDERPAWSYHVKAGI